MDTQGFFDATLYAYVAYCLEFCVRYFALAGGLYWLLHVRFVERWRAYRIQSAFPDRDSVRHEIVWSMANTAATGVSTVLTYHLIHTGHTRMYFTVAEHGWGYFVLSIILVLVGYDTWIYWQHRWLHTPRLFRWIHWVHHRVGNPTAFATFAQHPIETLMGNAFFVGFVVLVPIHPVALGAAGAYMFLHGTIGHLGYEFFPRGLPRHPVLRWFNTSTYHNMHHKFVRCNFGAWFTYWDHLLGTNDPRYLDTYDAVTARRAMLRTARATVAPADAVR